MITNINKVLSNQLIFVKSKSELFTSLLNTTSRILFSLKSNNVKPAVSGLRIFGHHVLKTVLFLGYCRWHINGGKSVAINLKRSSKIYKAVV